MNYHYCKNHYIYNRFKSRVVNIGGVPLGGSNPIRLQSMTTTDTLNTSDTIDQSIRIIKSGAEYVRITAPSKKEAQNLKKIKEGLKSKGYNTPLIADIHFTPNAAEIAAEIVPKVRINPGNYADRKKFKVFEISDIEYELELERIYERFSPLVKICKANGTVMRIGTNHGSLSDRIMNRYGDTPLGMVESALEFIRICEDQNFYDIVLSMKSSNPIIMVNAYRLLVSKMIENKMNYPLHLGVTEAGDGMPGRVKSSIGIGSLLEDGIGDTVRVSLTEEPEFEIPVAKKISDRYKLINSSNKILNNSNFFINPFEYKKRETINVQNFGLNNVPRVVNDLSDAFIDFNLFKKIGYHYLPDEDKWLISDDACDYIITDGQEIPFNIPVQLKIICKYDKWKKINRNSNYFPILTASEYMNFHDDNVKFVIINQKDLDDSQFVSKVKDDSQLVFVIKSSDNEFFYQSRLIFNQLNKFNIKNPVLIFLKTKGTREHILVNTSIFIGGLMVDGLCDGICISSDDNIDIQFINSLSFEILQSTRTRISKTDYISCPSCGRTQFDLQETTNLVREKTSHLKGLKIAVMGCIVNGPGEMADADYGYVGTGLNKISLYKKHERIKSNISSDNAVEELVNLIKLNGDWIEP
mgnify:FL=1